MMENSYNITPENIKLLFENEQLNLLKVLILLQILKTRSQKKFYTVEDIVVYYSLVNFDLIKLLNEDAEYLVKNKNRYLRFNKSINQVILELNDLNYIDIKGDLLSKKEKLGIRLNKEGEAFVETFDSEYFLNLKEIYRSIITDISNDLLKKNKIKGLLK
ncbi:hypothetical protein GMB70_09335 [Turicibacter sanguinis]|nr:hypothetical protein [Turicibacter sanguinis]